MTRLVALLVVGSIALAACSRANENRVIVAAGTTVVDSGLLDSIVAKYESVEPSIEISVVGDSSSAVLELGRRGGAAVLIVHAPAREAAFVDEGLAALYEPVFTSRFVIVGPAALAGELSGSPVDVFATIAARELPFVSRADGSGTHEREQAIWELAGTDPEGADWYIETGQGMGLTLQVANQRSAFTLAELGAYLAAEDTLSLREVPADGDARLSNPYHVIVVGGSSPAAAAFAEYLIAPVGQQDIAASNMELFGSLVYAPAAP